MWYSCFFYQYLNSSLAKDSFKFLTKYLATFSGEDANTMGEAKEEAVRTIIEFVKTSDMYQVTSKLHLKDQLLWMTSPFPIFFGDCCRVGVEFYWLGMPFTDKLFSIYLFRQAHARPPPGHTHPFKEKSTLASVLPCKLCASVIT